MLTCARILLVMRRLTSGILRLQSQVDVRQRRAKMTMAKFASRLEILRNNVSGACIIGGGSPLDCRVHHRNA